MKFLVRGAHWTTKGGRKPPPDPLTAKECIVNAKKLILVPILKCITYTGII